MSRNKAAAVAAAQPLDVSNHIMFPPLGGKKPAAVKSLPAPVPVAAKSFANIVKTMAEKAAEDAARAEHEARERERLRLEEERDIARYHSFHVSRTPGPVRYSAPYEREPEGGEEDGGYEETGGYNSHAYGGYNSNRYGVGPEEFEESEGDEENI